MHKELTIERNGDVQFLAGKMHEDQIAGLQFRLCYGRADCSCSAAVRGTRIPALAAA